MTPLLTWDWPETPLVIATIIAITVVVRGLLLRTIRLAVDSSLKRVRERSARQGTRAERILAAATGVNTARHEARTRTLGSVLRSFTTVTVVTVGVVTILETLGVPLAGLAASAGIGGIALGLGAQTLIKDTLSGMFMIMEDQFGVGDLIDTGEATGTVEEVGLRITRLRDASGQIWYVRNGEIIRIGNQSQGWSTASVQVPVAMDEDAAKVIELLKGVMDDVDADPRWESVLLQRPDVVGVDRVMGGAMVIKILARCAPNQQWGVERDILERSQTALRTAGVRGPVNVPGQDQNY